MEQRKVYLEMAKREKKDIEFDNLTYVVNHGKGRKQILSGLSGMFKSGELTAIMGPSGAGKSSLLNILSGFQKNGTTGIIRCSGQEEKASDKVTYNKDTCYIMQDDNICPLFTVWETMMFAAKLKLGTSIPEDSRHWLVSSILETLGLSGATHTRCNRISGGQRKRLSIALELIDNPPIMFLDEPTTGLDSLSSYQCISVLKKLAHDGRTIICTIHQPSASIFEMFDHVFLLAAGQCLYQGTSLNTVPFLSAVGLDCPKYHNPADHLIEVANQEYGDFNDDLAKVTRDSNWRVPTQPDKIDYAIEPPSKSNILHSEDRTMVLVQQPSEFYRFRVLLVRNMLQLYRDWTILHLRLILHILVGIFIGLLYLDYGNDASKTMKNIGYFIISMAYLSYTTMMPAVVKLPSEVNVLKKENFNNWYKLRTYYMSFIVVHLPVQVVFATIYTVSSYFISGQSSELSRFGMYTLIMVLSTLTAESIGVVLGTSVNPVTLFYLKIVIHMMVGFFIGVFYQGVGNDAATIVNNVGYLCVAVIYMGYTSMVPAVLKLPAEVLFVRIENFNNWYCLRTYYAMYMASSIPQQIIYALIFTIISYTMSSQPFELQRYLMFFVAAVMLNIIGDTIGQIIGTCFKASNGTFIAGVITAYFVLLNGFLVVISQSQLASLLSFTSYQRYIMHALMQSIYGNNRGSIECLSEYCHYNVQSILEEFSMNEHPYYVDLLHLIVIYISASYLGYLTLKQMIKRVNRD